MFPFFYKEDKAARDLLVEFLTQSAEAVGKTFDSKTLGSIGSQVETVAENLKNLAAETKESVEEATKAAVAALPKINDLRVNA
jgi:20S proteasome alpha/beta subunit